MNDDVRSPGSQSTPGPLSAQPPPGLDTDPGESFFLRLFLIFTRDAMVMLGNFNLPITKIQLLMHAMIIDKKKKLQG